MIDDHDGYLDVSWGHIAVRLDSKSRIPEEGTKSQGQQSQSCDFAKT